VMDAAGNTSTVNFLFRYDPSQQQEMSFPQNSISLLPNQENKLEFSDINVYFPPSSFYHLVPFLYAAQQAKEAVAASGIHSLHNYTVPVNDSFTVKIKLNDSVPGNLRDKVVMQLNTNKKKVAVKGPWMDNWMTARFWDLGSVRLLVDTIPPVIYTTGWRDGSNVKKKKSIALIARDNAGELRRFRAELNGSWLMFRRKDDGFIHDFDEHTSPGKHTLRVIAEDEAGNVSEKMLTFTR
jgi:hypothetical protein